MPKSKCVPCMSESLKKLIRNFTEDETTHRELSEIATCPVGEIMELCLGQARGGRRSPGKREPSAYQVFIGQCMRGKPIKGKPFGEAAKYMKECSLEWKRKKV